MCTRPPPNRFSNRARGDAARRDSRAECTGNGGAEQQEWSGVEQSDRIGSGRVGIGALELVEHEAYALADLLQCREAVPARSNSKMQI